MHKKLNSPRDTGQMIIAGTETFRLSCRKTLTNKLDTPFNNYGGNRQNIEKGMREVWIADDGYSFVQVDQSGAEALIVAYLCRSAKYRTLFQNGVKPHVYMALKLFPDKWAKRMDASKIATAITTPIPELKSLPFWKELESLIKSSDNWPSDERYYHIAKKTVHASSYGMRGNTFRMSILQESGGTIVISLKEAEAYLMKFHSEFPEIMEWHNRVFVTARDKKQLRNLFGFPYNITDFINENDYKDLIAWVPQSTVACITRQAYVKLQEYIESENKNWHLLNDCHDSYLAECPDNDIKECSIKMREFIEIELQSPFDGTKFRMKSEAQAGKNWSPAKEKNPTGLVEVKL
jgi:hypothetical protein